MTPSSKKNTQMELPDNNRFVEGYQMKIDALLDIRPNNDELTFICRQWYMNTI